MRNSRFFCSLMAAGALALCTMGVAANAASLPRVIATAPPGEKVVLHFQNAERIWMDGSGRLEVVSADGDVRLYRPALFQMIDGKRKTVTFSCHVVDHDHVELKPVHPDPSVPVELAPVHPITKTS